MTEPTRTISPGATLDYELDWSGWLQPGEAIAGFNPTAEGPATVDTSEVVGTVTRVWVSCNEGAAPPAKVVIRFAVVTNSTPARDDSRFWELTVARRGPGG